MDPNDQFKKRYDDFIAQRQQATTGVSNPQSKNRSPFNKFYALGVIAGLVIILPAIFLLIRQNTYTGSEIASTNETVTTAELNTEIQLMTGQDASNFQNNTQVLQTAQKNLLFRKAAAKIGITAPQQVASSVNEAQSYSLDQLHLQQSVEKKAVTNRTISYINVYIPPIASLKSQTSTVKNNLEFIRNELLNNRTVTVAYANLVRKLGTDPKYAVVENELITKEDGFDKKYLDAIFKSKKRDVSVVINANNTNFMVFKTNEAVNTNYSTLSAWEQANAN